MPSPAQGPPAAGEHKTAQGTRTERSQAEGWPWPHCQVSSTVSLMLPVAADVGLVLGPN